MLEIPDETNPTCYEEDSELQEQDKMKTEARISELEEAESRRKAKMKRGKKRDTEEQSTNIVDPIPAGLPLQVFAQKEEDLTSSDEPIKAAELHLNFILIYEEPTLEM